MFESLSNRLSSTIQKLRGRARLTEENIREAMRDVRIAHGRGHGVFRGWRGAASPDFMATNTFEDLGGCAQTMPSLVPGCGARQACR
mgnify:CR=1 FL=1